jgi:hypothetical protein
MEIERDPAIRGTISKLTSAVPQTSVKRTSDTGGSGSATKLQRTAKGGSKSQPSNSEDAARQVASRNGQVRSLDYPKPRAMDLNLDGGEEELYQSKMEFYQQASPFYFSGVWGIEALCFCMVWREGDERTNRLEVQQEMELCKMAHGGGVQSASVIDSLTAMDVSLSGEQADAGGSLTASREVYHGTGNNHAS